MTAPKPRRAARIFRGPRDHTPRRAVIETTPPPTEPGDPRSLAEAMAAHPAGGAR